MKCSGETIPRPFLKIKIEHISESIVYSFTQFIFIVCQVEDYQNLSKQSYRPFAAFPSYKVFLKNKKRSGTRLPVLFSA